MKIGILSMVALVASSAASAGVPSAPAVTIKASGQGHWEILCHVFSGSGEETIRAIEPGRDTLTVSNVRRASCNYKNASTGPLAVAVTSDALTCPFKVAADVPCEAQFGKSDFGTFELKGKR